MKKQKQIWLELLSYTHRSRDNVFQEIFKTMGILITGYYLASFIAFFCFVGHHCRQETGTLLLTFCASIIAAGFLFFKRIKAAVICFTVLLPLCVLAASFMKPSVNFSTSILLVAILSLLVTRKAMQRVMKFLLHTAIYIFIQLRYDLVPAGDPHQHLSLLNIVLLPFGCLFVILVFMRINRAFRLYREQHQQKRAHLAEANATLKNLLSLESKQKQKLKKTVAFKQQLISILSHDIRTPLFAYRMLIDGYEKKYYNEKDLVEEFVNSKQELIRIDEMTSDLVKWAKGEARAKKKETVSRSQWLTSMDGIRMIYAKSLKNKNITMIVTQHIKNSELLCIGRRQLETVVRNLLSNAIKFSYAGNAVWITVAPDEKKPSLALLTVKDFGTGMPKQKLKELNKYSNTSSKGTANEAGLGIGLSLVFDILNRNELPYEIESEPGIGTTFKIWIPLKTAEGINSFKKDNHVFVTPASKTTLEGPLNP